MADLTLTTVGVMIANYDMKEIPKYFNEFAHNSVLQLFTHLK